MIKDFTDYVMVIFDAGDRVFHLVHLKNGKGIDINHKQYPRNSHKYVLELDRAYKVRWVPWPRIIKGKKNRVDIYLTLRELFRSKKVGMLLYQEPCTLKCALCKVENIPVEPSERSYQKCMALKVIPEKVEPIHISRVHQPSGEVRG